MPKIWCANKQNASLLVYADATQLQSFKEGTVKFYSLAKLHRNVTY